MILNTIAEGMSLAKKLENESGTFYEAMAYKFPQGAETFQSLAKENQKFIQQIDRAYYGVITDAIEGCFALSLDTTKYIINTNVSERKGFKEVINLAEEIENTLIHFYTDAASQCESLMADVPRAFKLVAKKRDERVFKLKML